MPLLAPAYLARLRHTVAPLAVLTPLFRKLHGSGYITQPPSRLNPVAKVARFLMAADTDTQRSGEDNSDSRNCEGEISVAYLNLAAQVGHKAT
jgi:hypothetical protein